MAKGFKDEKELWKWMRPKMRGIWYRTEYVIPDGYPDVHGSYIGWPIYVELKISNRVALGLFEPGQRLMFPWLASLKGISVYVAYGDPSTKIVRWGKVVRDMLVPTALKIRCLSGAPGFFKD